MRWTFSVAEAPYFVEWVDGDPPRIETDNDAVRVALGDVLTLRVVSGPPQPRSIAPSYDSPDDAWLTVLAVLTEFVDAGVVDDLVSPDNPMQLAEGSGIDGAPDEIEAIVAGGPGSGPRPGVQNPWYNRGSKVGTRVDRIKAKADELAALMDRPLVLIPEMEDPEKRLLTKMADGTRVPGPLLKKAERLVRSIGKSVAAEIVSRGGVDLPSTRAEYDKLMKESVRVRADIRAARKAAVDEMLSERYGSVDEARSAIGDSYHDFRIKLENEMLSSLEAQIEGRFLLSGPGRNPAYEWKFNPEPFNSAMDRSTAINRELVRLDNLLSSGHEEWSATAAQVLDEIRGVNRPDNPLQTEIEQVGRQARSVPVSTLWGEATRNLPDEWVSSSNRPTIPSLKTIVRDDVYRASATPVIIRVSPSSKPDTYAHELVHRLQDYDPKWLALDYAFLQRRAGRQEPKALNRLRPNSSYGDDEVARPDKLPDPYAGKVYKLGPLGFPRASEVSTMGVQAYVRGDLPSMRQRNDKYFGTPGAGSWGVEYGVGPPDTDFIHYTLGVLATQGRLP